MFSHLVRVAVLGTLMMTSSYACPWMLYVNDWWVKVSMIDPDAGGFSSTLLIPFEMTKISPLYDVWFGTICFASCDLDAELRRDSGDAPGDLLWSLGGGVAGVDPMLDSLKYWLVVTELSGIPLSLSESGWDEPTGKCDIDLLLVGIPEPGTGVTALLGIALLGIAGMLGRRRRRPTNSPCGAPARS